MVRVREFGQGLSRPTNFAINAGYTAVYMGMQWMKLIRKHWNYSRE